EDVAEKLEHVAVALGDDRGGTRQTIEAAHLAEQLAFAHGDTSAVGAGLRRRRRATQPAEQSARRGRGFADDADHRRRLRRRGGLQCRQFLRQALALRFVQPQRLELTFTQLNQILGREDVERRIARVVLPADDLALFEAAEDQRAGKALEVQALQIDIFEERDL